MLRSLRSALLPALLLAAAPVLANGPEAEGLRPAEALDTLTRGNARFAAGRTAHQNQGADRRRALAKAQHPHTIVLSCSDSRVPPELVFDQGLGDLFVVRVAGNVTDPEALASVEYAVEHLGARLIVAMGHESCGAVKAALAQPDGVTSGSANLDALLASVKGNLRRTTLTPADRADPLVYNAVHANVDAVTRRMLADSPLLREKVESGQVAVVPAVYSLTSGKVSFWNTEQVAAQERAREAQHPAGGERPAAAAHAKRSGRKSKAPAPEAAEHAH